VRNPFGLEGQPWVAFAANVGVLALLVCILASVVGLILRYRRSRGEERQQIKWIAFAASSVGFGFVGAMVSGLIAFGGGTADSAPLWFDLLFTVVLLSFGGVPVAVGIAVLRYRLYDIDLIINRALVYGSLTAMLVLVYFGGVVSLQAALRSLTGRESTLAVVASTLAIAALFSPLRRRVQALVDRRFYRRKYDAAKTLAAFNARLRDETDLDTLGRDLMGVVRGAMQPEHVSLWLGPESAQKAERED
jgi:NO-binding membrane sensor protein with MHYT domain